MGTAAVGFRVRAITQCNHPVTQSAEIDRARLERFRERKEVIGNVSLAVCGATQNEPLVTGEYLGCRTVFRQKLG